MSISPKASDRQGETYPSARSSVELSVVMPCLNEADTLAACIEGAQRALAENNIEGEIIIADNGSTDESHEIAARAGVRFVQVKARGYGNALMCGIGAARGKFIIMGDSDESYDFSAIPRFVEKLREGYDVVQGCRLPSGGGRLMPGAMPFLHQWVGNPLFSYMARRWFKAPVHDVNCGLRGFTKEHYEILDQRCTGMEFANEMIIKSSLRGARITEVPITLYRDGRTSHAPHLRTFRDGWRTLRFYLLYSPRWLFLVPGALLILAGLVGFALGMLSVTIRGVRLDVHTLIFATLAILCGYQAIVFALLTRVFAISEGLMPSDRRITRFLEIASLERGLLAGAVALLAGIAMLAVATNQWREVNFGDLDYTRTMRWVIPGAMLTALGFQTILSSFLISMFRVHRR